MSLLAMRRNWQQEIRRAIARMLPHAIVNTGKNEVVASLVVIYR